MFAERLKSLRINKGDNQTDISNFLEITPNAYRKYEYGERKPDFDTLIKLCEYFKVTADYFFNTDSSYHAIGGGYDEGEAEINVFERITRLSSESRSDLEKYLSMLEMRDKQV